ncbi:MAG: beta-propeller fold lactonase family protein, partial [Actinomycetota bacterium]|nr:beta-propeller fold lactonase family protein [Actinomycetota bacterium]
MRRLAAVWMLAMGLAAAGCGTTQGADQDKVSAGSRPAVDRERSPSVVRPPSVLTPGRLRSQVPDPGSGGGDGEGSLVRQLGPALPQAGPLPPAPAGPAVPGDKPSAQPNALEATTRPVQAALADVPVRVYVPNSDAHTVTVIDPATLEVIGRFATNNVPHHITPSWDMTKLYVNNTSGNTLSIIDPKTGKPGDVINVIDPYNLYFTPDGTKAIVVAERLQRLDYRDPKTWNLIKSVPIPGSGVDHMDFSADGRYLIASTEFSGHVVKVDNVAMEVAGYTHVGGLPIDVKMAPDGSVFFVTNQGRHGVSVIDPEQMIEIAFLPTARGAHGLNYSRDTKRLFVSNRLAGSISVIDVASRQVVETWNVGGSPDMLQVSTDGTRIWVSNRFHGSVSVINAADGSVIKTIPTGAGAHGVCLFPQPGRYSVG